MDTKPIQVPNYIKFNNEQFANLSNGLILQQFKVLIPCAYCNRDPIFRYSETGRGISLICGCVFCDKEYLLEDGRIGVMYRNQVLTWLGDPYPLKARLVDSLEILYNKWKFQQWMINAKPFDAIPKIIIPESFRPKTLFNLSLLNEL